MTTPPSRPKRKSLAERKKEKRPERHVLDNPYRIRWPVHPSNVIESALLAVKSEICCRHSAACVADSALNGVRGKRAFGHRLEKERELIFSLNCVTKLFEEEFEFKAIMVEESLIPTRIFDHILYLCGLREVGLVKGQISVYLSSSLGRKKVAIVGVPSSSSLSLGDLTCPSSSSPSLGDLTCPVLPFRAVEKLPEIVVRVQDVTPSEEAVRRKRIKQEAKLKQKTAAKNKMEVD